MASLMIVGIVLFMSVLTGGTETRFNCYTSEYPGLPTESCVSPRVCVYILKERDDGSLKEKQHCNPWQDYLSNKIKPCSKGKGAYMYHCRTELCNGRNPPCTTWTDEQGNTGPWPDFHGGRGGSAGGDGVPPSGQSGIDGGNGGPPSGQDGGAGGGAGPPGAATPPKNGVAGFKSLKGDFSAHVIKALLFLC